jgi:hypothetical protein
VKNPTVASSSGADTTSDTETASSTPHTTSSGSSSSNTAKPKASAISGCVLFYPALTHSGSNHIRSKSSPPIGLIIGVTFGATVLLLILALLAFLRIRKRRRRYHTDGDIRPVIDPAFLPHSSNSSASDSAAQHIQPFMGDANVQMTKPVSGLSSKAARVRQEYLTNQMRAVQKQLEELQGVSASASLSKHPPSSEGDGDELRRQNEVLQGRIRTLEEQLHSRWALGLSDEPPPGYGE